MSIRIIILLALFLVPALARADQVTADCIVKPIAKQLPVTSVRCSFSQYQGHIYLSFPDKKTVSLSPKGHTPGNYVDQDGHQVYRKKGLGKEGQVYQFKHKTLYVYWDLANTAKNQKNLIASPLNITTKPLDYQQLRINITGDTLHFAEVMRRQDKDIFTASNNKHIVILNVNTGQVIILNKSTGKLQFSGHTTPIPSFENPDTMCDPNTEPC